MPVRVRLIIRRRLARVLSRKVQSMVTFLRTVSTNARGHSHLLVSQQLHGTVVHQHVLHLTEAVSAPVKHIRHLHHRWQLNRQLPR